MIPSASQLARAMACPGSVALPQLRESSEASERGTRIHAAIASVVGLTGDGKRARMEQLRAEMDDDEWPCVAALAEEFARLDVWLVRPELAMAFDVSNAHTRVLGSNIARDYSGVRRFDVHGTADVVARAVCPESWSEIAVVIDFKTGAGSVGTARASWQLRALAVCAAALDGVDEVEAMLLHVPPSGQPRWSRARFDRRDLDSYRDQLRDLGKRVSDAMEDVDARRTPQLAAGPQCKHCPARLACPMRVGIIRSAVATGAAELGALRLSLANATPEELSAAWARAEPFIDAASELRSALLEASRSRPFALGAGRWVGVLETAREQVDGLAAYEAMASVLGREFAERHVEMKASKASIERACAEFLERSPSASGSRAALVRAVLEGARARGGVTVRSSPRVGVHSGRMAGGEET